jgi:hypothetical protein
MLENERIIVDRGGIDPGIAALMQNANKGFDPAALMAMMNNGNGMFGGNGFGRGFSSSCSSGCGADGVATASVVATRLKPTLTSLV